MTTTGAWYDDPQLWAAVVNAAGQYASASKQGGGKFDFKLQPETPEEKALRIHAQRLAGIPNPDGTITEGAMPTYRYLAPQINNMIQNLGTSANSYQPLERLDATGKPIARTTPAATPFDYAALAKPWEFSMSPAPETGSIGAGAPPPPPEVKVDSGSKRRKKVLGGFIKGAIGGMGWAPTALVGGAVGAIQQRDKNRKAWDAAYADYNQWLALYGNSFTDASGKPVAAPKNLKEYNAWYVAKYGTLPPTTGGG